MGFQLLKMGVMVKRPITYTVRWEIFKSLTHFESCAQSSLLTGRRQEERWLFIFPCRSCLMGLSLWEKSPLSSKSRQRHSTTTPLSCYMSYTPPSLSPQYFWLLSELSLSLCVQLQELLLGSNLVPYRFNLLLFCCLCCKALYNSFMSALSPSFPFCVDTSNCIRVVTFHQPLRLVDIVTLH